MERMVRTNVVIDQELLEKVMSTFGLATKRAAVDFALHAVLSETRQPSANPWKAALELEGLWADRSETELREIYGDKIPVREDQPHP